MSTQFSSLTLKARDQLCFPEDIGPPGATSGDYYLSEAAKVSTLNLYLTYISVKEHS